MKLFVGLGNPGDKYSDTRHNIGFEVLDIIAEHFEFTKFLFNKKFNAYVANGIIGKWQIIAIKPQTFMNLSGVSVAGVANFYKIEPKDIFVIQDDLDISSCQLKIKYGGSAGGHNGIKSITEKLGTDKFWRYKIGIGRPENKDLVHDYVLSRMSQDEKLWLEQNESKLIEKVQEYLRNSG